MSQFAGAGRKPGLELWRVEKLAVVKQPNVSGKFYSGDSYILLATTANKSGSLSWAIHFWLGSETSTDEAGIAAYKSVELDESLGGGPVQYREVQFHESSLFLSYFKNSGGVEYLAGGVESGFKKVERDVYETRLLHVKGKRDVRVKSVPVELKSLNKGDVFVLDKGLSIFIFNGPNANKLEKSKGLEVARRIKDDERGGRAAIVLLDEDVRNAEFWGHFGGPRDPKSLPDGPSDDAVDAKVSRRIFKISDASGSIQFEEITPAGNRLSKEQLDTNDVFLVHGSAGKIFIWVGKKSNANEKREATNIAVQYLRAYGLDASTSIERVSEGNEPGNFKAEFASWDPPQKFGHAASSSKKADEDPINFAALTERKTAEDTPIDNGSGKLQIWVIKDFKKVELNPADYGEFHSGDSYILLYSYKKGRSDEYIIYFWLGHDSTADEKGSAALLAVELDDSLGGKPVQVRVTQGKEPAHFRQLFKGRQIVYSGGNESGFSKAGGHSGQSEVALFHIRGSNALNTSALQVPADASSLNSQDTFVFVTPAHVYSWKGTGANADEAAVAANVSAVLAGKYRGTGGRSVVPVNEGAEPADFWDNIGGKKDYAQLSAWEAAPRDPRLFSASTATGRFRIEEVDNFDQSDLNDEDVFLLDTFTQLFVWIGTQSSREEREKAVQAAYQYIAEVDDGRDADIPVVQVQAGQEPSIFTCHFRGWDAEYTKKKSFSDPYQAKLDALAEAKAKEKAINEVPAASSAPTTTNFSAPVKGAFTYEQLKDNLPDGVDPSRKEEYLDDASFKRVFNTDRAAFAALPKWKRDDAKKKVGLF